MWHLLAFMKTPMAAPETPLLRSMRLTILGICSCLAPSVLFFKPLHAAMGAGIAGIVAGLLFALVLLVPVYVRMKTKADDLHLDRLIADEESPS